MGKKAKWFSNMKKAFSPESKEKKEQKAKNKLLQMQNDSDHNEALAESARPPASAPPPVEDNVAEISVEGNENLFSGSAAVATSIAMDDPVVSPLPVSEVVQSTNFGRFAGKFDEEGAAVRIQTTFRGYMARRALRGLRGLARLKSLMEGSAVKRQTANSLKCMQTLSRVQAQIQARRIRMSEENQARQKQLLQKHAKELASLQSGEDWNDSTQSKEQVEAKLLSKYEATMRRERAMAYSYTHQKTWKNQSKTTVLMFIDPSNPTWGWSWLERWTAGRPLETTDKEPNNDNLPPTSASRSNLGDITKSYTRNQLNSTQNAPTARKGSRLSPSTPRMKHRRSLEGGQTGPDDDARSTISMPAVRNRRHSVGGVSSVRDDVSVVSSSSGVPSYMVPTKSARARVVISSSQSPSGLVNGETGLVAEPGTVKKRLSFPASVAPKPRRFSTPPKVENGGKAGIVVTNGGGAD